MKKYQNLVNKYASVEKSYIQLFRRFDSEKKSENVLRVSFLGTLKNKALFVAVMTGVVLASIVNIIHADSPIFHGRATNYRSPYVESSSDIQWRGSDPVLNSGNHNYCIYGSIASLINKYEHPRELYFSGKNHDLNIVQVPYFDWSFSSYRPNYQALKSGWDEYNTLDVNKNVPGNDRNSYNEAKYEVTRLYMAASAAVGHYSTFLYDKWGHYYLIMTLKTKLGYVNARYLDPAWRNASDKVRYELLAGRPVLVLAQGHAYFLDKYENGKYRTVEWGEDRCTGSCYELFTWNELLTSGPLYPPMTFVTHLDPDIPLGGSRSEFKHSFIYGDPYVPNSGGVSYYGKVQIENRGHSDRRFEVTVEWGQNIIGDSTLSIPAGQLRHSSWYTFDVPPRGRHMYLDVTVRDVGNLPNPEPIRITMLDDRDGKY